MKPHVSFSELYTYETCQYKHKIEYLDGIKQPESIHAIFGKAVHAAIETRKKTGNKLSWIQMCKDIISWIRKNPKDKYFGDLDHESWCRQGLQIYSEIFDWLDQNFPEHKLIANEFELYETISENDDLKFKGFIDLIIKDKEDQYHIIDFKTCSWGWDKDKRSDTKKQYQLTLYKKFFCQKEKISEDSVKTHFILLKRTPPKNQSSVELYTISSGKIKLKNADDWMNKQISQMKRGFTLKNRTACKFCPWFKTERCT